MRSLWLIFLFLFCFSPSLVVPSFISYVVDGVTGVVKKVFPTRCFEYLGCFSSGPPFYDPVWRPASRLPQEGVKPVFLLYTPTFLDDAYQLRMSEYSVFDSIYDASLPTKILIHGFIVKMDPNNILLKIKDELLKAGKFNVIVVNWEDANSFPYEQAAANARKIGAQIAYLLSIMKDIKGLKYEDVHMIGHSLGAHISGYTGKRIDKIGRITGLDPAGPYFEHAPPEVRLTKADASFVDIIHTDGGEIVTGAFGLPRRIGSQDFYPNGGTTQPGCQNASLGLNAVGDQANICQHSISQFYFLYSINDCRFFAVQCDSYEQFQEGNCTKENSPVAEMGYHAQNIGDIQGSPKFYLQTSEDPPYCVVDDRIGVNS